MIDIISQFIINNPILKVVITLMAASLLLVPLNILIFRIFKSFWNEKAFDVKSAFRKVKMPLQWAILSIVLFVAVNVYQLPGKLKDVLAQILSIVIIFSVTWLLIRIIRVVRDVLMGGLDVGSADNLRARKVLTQFRIFEKFITFILILIAISAALMLFEKVRQLGVNILASAGVAGIIVGFAAQKSIANILAGIQIAITQPIRIDDVVIIEGEWGWIEEINLTYVVVKIWDLRRLVVPITFFLENTFQNWTRTSSDILGTVFIYVDYTAPVHKIREELTNIQQSSEAWDGKVNVLQVTNVTDKTIELRALMSAHSSPDAFQLRTFVRERLIVFLQEKHPECLPKFRIEEPKG